jgi:hypothetical protein
MRTEPTLRQPLESVWGGYRQPQTFGRRPVMKRLALLATALFFGVAAASDYPRVDEDIQYVDQRITFLREGFAKHPVAINDKEWVKRKLQHMVDIGSVARDIFDTPVQRQYSADERIEFMRQMDERRSTIDRQNSVDFKKLLELYAWFPISQFGAATDEDAWLLFEQIDFDAPYRRKVLAVIEPLVAKNETNPVNFAFMVDRVATSYQDPAKRKPQRYGTQGECSGPNTWDPFPVEDPQNLDARRTEVGLGPMAEHKAHFAELCRKAAEESNRHAQLKQ